MGEIGRRLAVVALALGIGVAAVACSSGSGGKGVSLAAAGRGTTTTAEGGTSAAAPNGGATGTSAPAASGAGGNAPTAARTVAPPGPTVRPAATTATTGPKVTTPGPAGPAPAAPGTYTYTLVAGGHSLLTTGTTTMSLTPAATNSVVVTSTGGGAQQWVTNASSTTNLAFTGAGVFLQSETVPAVGTCTFSPPMASPPWPLAVGKTFSGTANCGSATLTLTGSVGRSQLVPVGGVNVSAFLVQSTFTVSGTTLVVNEVDWYAPSLRLPVVSNVRAQGGASGYSVDSNTTYALASSRPA
jgi:hypothetical protein